MDEYRTIKDLPIVIQESMIAYGHNTFMIIRLDGETYCSTRYKPKGLVKSVGGRSCIYRLLGEDSYRLSIEDTNLVLQKMGKIRNGQQSD